jgi:hypothetical protein
MQLLDKQPEFRCHVLEAERPPLEKSITAINFDGQRTLHRTGDVS